MIILVVAACCLIFLALEYSSECHHELAISKEGSLNYLIDQLEIDGRYYSDDLDLGCILISVID